MAKRYANLALSYAVIAMAFGVFFREFTKFNHFTGQTSLSFLHGHYFMLGMFFFLMLLLVEKVCAFSDGRTSRGLTAYQVGLNRPGRGLLRRGGAQVGGPELSRGLDASISGIAGIGHILMGFSLALLLVKIQKSVG